MPTLDIFSQCLIESGLITAEDLESFLHTLPATPQLRDGDDLASQLVRQGRLTTYQAMRLLKGETEGLVLGNYVVLDRLGAGGMGQVFKAEHRRMRRTVAIKILQESLASDATFVRRFHREVQAAARLMHPNIVTAFDADEVNGRFFLVMEYVPGRDLASTVRRDGPLSIAQAISCALDAARGLKYAHSQGVIHRDIKPGNLLWTTASESPGAGTTPGPRMVKVLDMGLARLDETAIDEGPQADLTSTGILMGTADYVSPEQAFNTKCADHRSDIYSLGITIYSLLTGNPAYPGGSVMERLLRHREAPIPVLRDARPDAPEDLETLFRRMVAKRPEDRLQTMAEVVEALEALRAGRPIPDLPSGIPGGVTISRAAPTRQISLADSDRMTGANTSLAMAPTENANVAQPDRGQSGVPGVPKWQVWPTIAGLGVMLLGLAFVVFTWGPPSLNTAAHPHSSRGAESEDAPPVLPIPIAQSDNPGASSSALLFDGVDDFVDTTFQFVDSHPMTFEAWITPGCTQSDLKQEVFSNAETAGISFFLRKSYPTFMLHTGDEYIANFGWRPVPCGEMAHVAAVYNGISTGVFINGVPQGFKVPTRRNHRPSPLPIYLGANPDPQLLGRPTATIRDPYSGAFHQFRITRAARYDQEFEPAAVLKAEEDTVLLYHFFGGAGSKVVDLSGNGYDGEIVGATWGTFAQLADTRTRAPVIPASSSRRFSGIGSRAEVPDLGLNLLEPFTLEAWCLPEAPADPSQRVRIVARLGPADLRIQNGIQWKFAASSPSKSWKDGVFAPQSLSLGMTHLAGQWDGEELALYVDGKRSPWPFQTNESSRSPHELIQEIFQSAESGTLTIGGTPTHGPFGGLIYSVRVSRGARYSATFVPGELLADEQTEALFVFSEGTDETLHDLSGNGHDGTVTDADRAQPEK